MRQPSAARVGVRFAPDRKIMDVVTGRWAKPMIKKAKQYSAHHTDRFWLKVAYLMLVLGVGILAVSAITNPDSYPFRRTGPVVEGEGVDATAEYEDVGLLLEEGNSQEAYRPGASGGARRQCAGLESAGL